MTIPLSAGTAAPGDTRFPVLWPPTGHRPGRHGIRLAGRVTTSGPWCAVVRDLLAVLDPQAVSPPLFDRVPPGEGRDSVHIATTLDPGLPVEAFALVIDASGVQLRAGGRTGAVWACQTLRAMLPAAAWRSTARRRDDWMLPHGVWREQPAFAYRGFHLDTARHFIPVSELLRWVDLVSMHRLNHLHLHLTDDQGWRIDLPEYPRLAEVASWRPATMVRHLNQFPGGTAGSDATWYDGTPHGGCYSPADLDEVVRYAHRRGVTIVPEVDLPGHGSALLAALPELAPPGAPPSAVRGAWGIWPDVISPLPAALDRVGELLAAVARIIDSPYLHFGGDEVLPDRWLASPEVMAFAAGIGGPTRIQAHVNATLAGFVSQLGRRPIAWDDAFCAGGLPADTIVMPWRAESIGRDATLLGHDVVMTPALPTYFDHGESDDPQEPLAIAASVTSQTVAEWVPRAVRAEDDPLQRPPLEAGVARALRGAVDDAPRGRILGGQAQLWTEYMPTREIREYRTFPRLSLLAANLWTGDPGMLAAAGGATGTAMAAHLDRLRAFDVQFRAPSGPRPWQRGGTGPRSGAATPEPYLKPAER